MADPLYWYSSTVCTDPECTETGYHPGPTTNCPGVIPGLARIHAYDPWEPMENPEDPHENPPTTCLVGSIFVLDYGWCTSKTLAEAQAIYEAYYGAAPTSSQVY